MARFLAHSVLTLFCCCCCALGVWLSFLVKHSALCFLIAVHRDYQWGINTVRRRCSVFVLSALPAVCEFLFRFSYCTYRRSSCTGWLNLYASDKWVSLTWQLCYHVCSKKELLSSDLRKVSTAEQRMQKHASRCYDALVLSWKLKLCYMMMPGFLHCCLSNAMHSIGQSIKSPECLCVRASVRASYIS